MHDTSCRREDIVTAYQELVNRLNRRRQKLWNAYLESTRSMSSREYASCEAECWSVLAAGISGIDAEQRVLKREYELRLSAVD